MDPATSSWDAHRDVEAVFVADGRSALQFRPRPPAPAAMMITDDSGLSEEAACGGGGGGGGGGGAGDGARDGLIMDPILQVESDCQPRQSPSARPPPYPSASSPAPPPPAVATAYSIRFLLSSQADAFSRALSAWQSRSRSAPPSAAAATTGGAATANAAAAGAAGNRAGGGGGGAGAGAGSVDCEGGGIQNGVAAGEARDEPAGTAPSAPSTAAAAAGGGGAGGDEEGASAFDRKIEASSAKMYFHYYGQLLHQQNMLQDYVRTGTYYAAVMENRADFEGKIVVDVGAGSGILSLFAARVRAAPPAPLVPHLSAPPLSAPLLPALLVSCPKCTHARSPCLLLNSPPLPSPRLRPCPLALLALAPSRSTALPVLFPLPATRHLRAVRMLETYVIARNRFLKPGGKMFPSAGRIHVAPFSDEYLYVEMANKALFWQQRSYYGVDLTPLHGDALNGYFAQVR
ncbi:unnamed protein product [Closterium sp. NIES-54]